MQDYYKIIGMYALAENGQGPLMIIVDANCEDGRCICEWKEGECFMSTFFYQYEIILIKQLIDIATIRSGLFPGQIPAKLAKMGRGYKKRV